VEAKGLDWGPVLAFSIFWHNWVGRLKEGIYLEGKLGQNLAKKLV